MARIVGKRDIYQDQLIDYKPRVVSLALCQKNCQEFTDTIQGKTRTNTSLRLIFPSMNLLLGYLQKEK